MRTEVTRAGFRPSLGTGVTRVGAALLLLLLFAACKTLTIQEEKQLGRQVQAQIRQQMTLLRDPVIVNYIRDMGEKLAKSAPESPFDLKFYVVEEESINAFAVPGGAIYIHTGLISATTNAGELAGVVAHEIGHATLRHVAKSARRNQNVGFMAYIVRIAVMVVTGVDPWFVPGMVAQAYLAPFSQEAESEADDQAVDTMIRAGFDPDSLATMFETMQRESGGGFRMPQFLQTHPATADRIDQVRAEIARRGDLSQLGLRRDDGGRHEIIKQRLDYIIGTDVEDFEDDVEDEELEEDDDDAN